MNQKFINDLVYELSKYLKTSDLDDYKSFIRHLNLNKKYFLKLYFPKAGLKKIKARIKKQFIDKVNLPSILSVDFVVCNDKCCV